MNHQFKHTYFTFRFPVLFQTSPYRPQSNGVVERLHGTLKPMLAKAVDAGFDWVEFLPLALFALRQIPNRDCGRKREEDDREREREDKEEERREQTVNICVCVILNVIIIY